MKRGVESEVLGVEYEFPQEIWSLIFSLVDESDARFWFSLLSLSSEKYLPRGWCDAITQRTNLAFAPQRQHYYNTEKVVDLMGKFPLLSALRVQWNLSDENSFRNVPVGKMDRIRERLAFFKPLMYPV